MRIPPSVSPSARFILLVIGLVVFGAVVMVPRRDERLAVMLDEGQQAQVVAILEPRLASGDIEPSLLVTLGLAHAALGNSQRAVQLLQRYAAIRPKDLEVYARLADVYGKFGDRAEQIAMLERQVALGTTPARILELAGLYGRNGRPADELALLGRFEAALAGENGALARLARLRAGAGDPDGAIRVLRRVFGPPASSRPDLNAEERVFLAELLAGNGQGAEATALGAKWLRQWLDPYWAGRLLRTEAAHAPAEAMLLADAVTDLHPEIRFYLVRALTEDGSNAVAHHLLETWPKANPLPSMEQIAGFLTACREQNQQDLVWRALGTTLADRSAEAIAPLYAEAIAAEFGIGALAPFWGDLLQPVLTYRPLLAARLAFHERSVDLAKRLVGVIDPSTLSTGDRRIWTDLLTASATPVEAFKLLYARRSGGRLPPDVLVVYAKLAGELGQEVELRSVLKELSRDLR